jgi:peptidoglycan LD-endopeptidase LytH
VLARALLPLCAAGWVAACTAGAGDDGELSRDTPRVVVDTVIHVDTIVRVDTLFVLDSLVGLGGASDVRPPPSAGSPPAASPPPVGSPPAATSSAGTAPGGAPLAASPLAGTPLAAPTPTPAPSVASSVVMVPGGGRAIAPGSRGPAVTAADFGELRRRQLLLPVVGVLPQNLLDTFAEGRGGGSRVHGALDIPAPRGTRVLSADNGTVAKIDTSAGGGLSVYVLDQTRRFIYYYAHLDAYRPGLAEGQAVRKGDWLGNVGTTGNAPPNLPHLHFAIARSDDPSRWWAGTPLDPRPLFTQTPAR